MGISLPVMLLCASAGCLSAAFLISTIWLLKADRGQEIFTTGRHFYKCITHQSRILHTCPHLWRCTRQLFGMCVDSFTFCCWIETRQSITISIYLTSVISDHTILSNHGLHPEVPVHQSCSWTLCRWFVVSQTVSALSNLFTSLCFILPPWQTVHLFSCSVVSLDGNQKNKKSEEKNIFSSPGTNSSFMLIMFSHDYNGQKVRQAAHAVIFHLFVEDYGDLHVLFVEKQTGRQCRKNSSSTGAQPAPTAFVHLLN